ncbi:GGDEF domain-containing protein [Butyrivibrio sp.]|uniref:GGDEF domain-containing protein n=1 Tax=Butyrivibrio sp. TaxID=28121 RepID=UPI0025C1DF66|nr:GGDEF domain-containing protein [Butyrivibrio sp.]MBQ9303283.1 GGDEF domain-containing protein [Butyrivibrio sp.]
MIEKLISFFLILVASVLVLTGVSSYFSQMSVYRAQSEEKLQSIVTYLAKLMNADGGEFLAYQELSLALSDEVRIPMDFDGDYHEAKNAFYDSFDNAYPGLVPGKDIDYKDMPHDMQVLYVTYKQEYWMHMFDSVSENLGVIYTYYVVPTGESEHMYFIIDALREAKVVDGKEYIQLNLDAEQKVQTHEHMWAAWDTGEYTPGFDIYDNEYGKTYACYHPVYVDGVKTGVVCSEIEIANVDRTILENAIRQTLVMAVLMTIFGAILSYVIGRFYIRRLIILKEDVIKFTEEKDVAIADKIKAEITGTDEIHDLASQISIMISEISIYMQSLIDKNRELTEAQEKIRAANELANRDALTGIRNKTAYDNEVKKIEYRIASEGFNKFGIAMVDLNYLKVINDNFGHEKGNISIKKICMIVCKNFTHSPVFRIGGDEFVVILENEDYENATDLVEKFKDTLNGIGNDDSLEPWEKVSAAIGWTVFEPDVDKGVQNVFKRADDLMYENKKAMKATRE